MASSSVMDLVYSRLLIVALILGAVGTLSSLASGWKRMSDRSRQLAKLGLVCGGLALVSGLVSALVHAFTGHGSDSLEPMGWGRFLFFHKAYGAVLVLGLLPLSRLRFVDRRGR